jgi:hypothetical protein
MNREKMVLDDDNNRTDMDSLGFPDLHEKEMV